MIAAGVLALLAGLGGCGDDDERDVAESSTSTTEQESTTPTLAVEDVPSELPAGLVTTDEALQPAVTFEVPEGWYGHQNDTGFGLGKGLDTEAQDFADVGVFMALLERPVADAVSGFTGIAELEAGASSEVSIDGHDGARVEVTVTGDRAVLEPIGLMADTPQGGAVVTFLDVDGQTVMIVVQRWASDADKAEGQAVVDTFDFSTA